MNHNFWILFLVCVAYAHYYQPKPGNINIDEVKSTYVRLSWRSITSRKLDQSTFQYIVQYKNMKHSETCTVEGVTGVCRQTCESNSTSFCVPNVTDCIAVNPGAYCFISETVSCSTGNGDEHCSNVCSCDPQTSDFSREDICTAFDKTAVCCGPKSDTDETPFTRANISNISNSLVTKIFNGVESASCCQNLCSLEQSCKAFALFQDRETGNKICKLMNETNSCSETTPPSQLNLIDYFEKPELKTRNIFQVTHKTQPRSASEVWRKDCWSPKCPISAAIGFRDGEGLLDNEVDEIKCGVYSSDMVLLNAGAERMVVTSDPASRCKSNYLLTAIHDKDKYWNSPDNYKCLKLANWRTVDDKCTTETSLSLEEYTCPLSEGNPTYVVGIARWNTNGIQAITCCPVEKI